MAFLTLSVENLENLNGHMTRVEKKLVRLGWFGLVWFGLVWFGWLGWLVG